MTTKLIAIAIAIGIAGVVASNLIGMFSKINTALSSVASF